jgi:hypothetical protein
VLLYDVPYGASFRLGVFMLHLVLAPIALIVLAYGMGERSASTFIAESCGFALGLCVAKLMPEYAREGRWIFVVALAVFGWGVLLELWRSPLQKALEYFFYDSETLILFTLPGWGCCCYSAGIAFAQRLPSRPTIE